MLFKIKSLFHKVKGQVVAIAGAVGVALGVSATPSQAADLIDYAATATALQTALGTAITAAIGVGVAILTAKMGWRFFKSFTKG